MHRETASGATWFCFMPICCRLLAVLMMVVGFLFVLAGLFEFALIMLIDPDFNRSSNSILMMGIGALLVLLPAFLAWRERRVEGLDGVVSVPPISAGSFTWACCSFERLRHLGGSGLQFCHVHAQEGRNATDWKRTNPVSVPGMQVICEAACICCLEEFQPNSQVAILPCGHMYHEECIARWSIARAFRASCPSCRVRYDDSAGCSKWPTQASE